MAASSSIHHRRLRRFVRSLPPAGISAALVSFPPNLRYLCGFTGSSGVLAFAAGEIVFFTDGRYLQQAKQEVFGAKIKIDPLPRNAALTWLKQKKIKRLGVEAANIPAADWGLMQQTLRLPAKLHDAGKLLLELRMVKDHSEQRLIRAAARLGSCLFPKAIEFLRPGASENEVAAQMEFAARMAGAEGMSFSTIVASGPRSALPHGRASTARIPRRGFVVLDFGVILSGYCSDMTRTVHVGAPNAGARHIYETVREAQAEAVASVKPGRSFEEIDAAARNVIAREGLGKFFTHSTGHGVGLEIHEPPRLGAGQKGKLKPGMVITIEPGVYVLGKGGVRIEDMVLVTERGAEVLTRGDRNLITL